MATNKVKEVNESTSGKDSNPFVPLSKDLVNSAKTMSIKEAKYLVRTYYRIQDDRLRAAARGRALSKDKTPHALFTWLTEQTEILELQIKKALDKYTQHHPLGVWLRTIHGIGPVLAAGLIANTAIEVWHCETKSGVFKKKPKPEIDNSNLEEGVLDLEDDEEIEHECTPDNPCTASCHMKRISTAGGFWSYAGLDPRVKWEKGCIRPWNANLKKLCWLIGQSFVKQSYSPKCFYGHIYIKRKEYEKQQNEERVAKGEKSLTTGHIDARARRYAVKIFLSHFHAESYRYYLNEEPPKPYAIAILGHAHMIDSPVPSITK